MKQLLIILSFWMITNVTLAGPEHDHGAPTFQAKHGGSLQSTHENHFELVLTGQTLKLYVYDEKGQDLLTQRFKIKTELELPKNKKKPILFTDQKTHWQSEFNWQGLHRVTVKVNVFDGKESDNVQFTLENK